MEEDKRIQRCGGGNPPVEVLGAVFADGKREASANYGIADCSYTGGTDGVLTMHCWFAETECPGPWLSEQFERLSREVNAALEKQV